jgi:hypothetical protein
MLKGDLLIGGMPFWTVPMEETWTLELGKGFDPEKGCC